MQASAIPIKFPIPFGNAAGAGYIRPIPQASQIGITGGAASLTDGFPPLTFLPLGSGGVPPFGQDFNGLMKQVTQWSQWMNAGGPIPYDASFQIAISGYPMGAIVQSVSTFGLLYLCTVDNNTSNPDTGGAGWAPFNWLGGSNIPNPSITTYTTHGTYTFTVGANTHRVRGQLWGAGGGGGFGAAGSPGGGGSGGGGGAYCNIILSVNPGDTIAVVVGQGGAGGTSGSNGGNGGNSTINYSSTTYTASGGLHGTNASAGILQNSVAGGSPTNGDVTSQNGQSSAGGIAGYSGSIMLPYAGAGGSAPYGGYGGLAGTGAGNGGNSPGGGGAGGAAGNLTGAGSDGAVWISS